MTNKEKRILIVVTGLVGIVLCWLGMTRPVVMTVWGGATQSAISITASGIPNVTMFPLDSPKVDPIFVDWFESLKSDWSYFRPFVIILSNQAEEGIEALTLAWTVTDASGKTSTTYTTWDGYLNELSPGLTGGLRGSRRGSSSGANPSLSSVILKSQAQLLVVPAQCSPTNLCGNTSGTGGSIASGLLAIGVGRGGAGLRVPTKDLIQQLMKAHKVSVGVDLVVFSGGRLSGPDHSRTIANLQARDTAVRTLVERVHQAETSGGDIDTVLSQLAAQKATPETDIAGFYLADQARKAVSSNAPRQFLGRL